MSIKSLREQRAFSGGEFISLRSGIMFANVATTVSSSPSVATLSLAFVVRQQSTISLLTSQRHSVRLGAGSWFGLGRAVEQVSQVEPIAGSLTDTADSPSDLRKVLVPSRAAVATHLPKQESPDAPVKCRSSGRRRGLLSP